MICFLYVIAGIRQTLVKSDLSLVLKKTSCRQQSQKMFVMDFQLWDWGGDRNTVKLLINFYLTW